MTAKAPRAPPSLLFRAAARWAAITGVMTVLLVVYTQLPYFQRAPVAPFGPIYIAGYVAWLVLGLPYVHATLRRFQGVAHDLADPGLHLLLLARRCTNGARFLRGLRNRRVRTTVLSIAVKAFFAPIMAGFLVGHATALVNAWMHRKGLPPLGFTIFSETGEVVLSYADQLRDRFREVLPDRGDLRGLVDPGRWTLAGVRWVVDAAYETLFVLDCSWALVGYCAESRWLGNKTRSVDATLLGWAVTLVCYPPFTGLLGILAAFAPFQLPGPSPFHGLAPHVSVALKAIATLILTVYLAATFAFGVRFSNLTNRGIIDRGPYRYVRHPAYAAKCAALSLEQLPLMTPGAAIVVLVNFVIYGLRAWTEERHLRRDPVYVAYKARVRWAFIPGVI